MYSYISSGELSSILYIHNALILMTFETYSWQKFNKIKDNKKVNNMCEGELINKKNNAKNKEVWTGLLSPSKSQNKP